LWEKDRMTAVIGPKGSVASYSAADRAKQKRSSPSIHDTEARTSLQAQMTRLYYPPFTSTTPEPQPGGTDEPPATFARPRKPSSSS